MENKIKNMSKKSEDKIKEGVIRLMKQGYMDGKGIKNYLVNSIMMVKNKNRRMRANGNEYKKLLKNFSKIENRIFVKSMKSPLVEVSTLNELNNYNFVNVSSIRPNRINARRVLEISPISHHARYHKIRVFLPSRVRTLGMYQREMKEFVESDTNDIEDYNLERVTIFLYNTQNTERLLARTINPGEASEEAILRERIEEFYSHENKMPGSDRIDPDMYKMDFRFFDCVYTKEDIGNGVSNKIILKCKNIKSDRLCGLECLKHFGVDMSEEIYEKEGLRQLVNMVKYCSKANIEVIPNIFTFKKGMNKKRYVRTPIMGIKQGVKVKIWRVEFDQSDLEFYNHKEVSGVVECIKTELSNEKKYIIYDKVGCHYDAVTEIKLSEDLIITNTMQVLMKNDDGVYEVGKSCELYKKALDIGVIKPDKIDHRYIFFDYETVINWYLDNVNQSYSLSFVDLNEEQLDELSEADRLCMKNNIEKYKKDTHHYVGWDCTKRLVDYIKKAKDTRYTFVSYNGANFDNFILYNDISKLEGGFEILGKPFYSKSSLLNFKISGVHDMFDLKRHLVGSLKKNCQGFGVKMLSKGEFDHEETQELYDMDDSVDKIEFIRNMKASKDLEEYNKLDVLSLAIIYKRYNKALLEIENMKDLELSDNKTIGSMGHKKMGEHWSGIKGLLLPILHKRAPKKYRLGMKELKPITYEKIGEYMDTLCKVDKEEFYKYMESLKKTNKDNEIDIDTHMKKIFKEKIEEINAKARIEVENKLMDNMKVKNKEYENIYNDLLKYKCAGRVELFNGPQKFKGRIYSLDVCSLYPFVMAILDVYYPCGKIKTVEKYEEMPKDKIGFFYCDIDQSILHKTGKCLIYPEKKPMMNDWNTNNKLCKYFISTPDIELLEEYKCEVKKYSGIYFTDKIKGCELFAPLLKYMLIKNQQDQYKKDKDPRYNESLRETIKLLSNCESGKLIEGLHLSQVELLGEDEIDPKTMGRVNYVGTMNNKYVVSYNKSQEMEMQNSKPIYLGCLVYSYARGYMYRNILSKIDRKNMFYTDTDSCKINQEGYDQWIKTCGNTVVPHWIEVEEIDPRYKEHTLYNPNSKVYGSFENEYPDNFDMHYFIAKKEYYSGNSEGLYEINKDPKYSFKGIGPNDVLLDDEIDYSKYSEQELFKLYQIGSKIKNNLEKLYSKLYDNVLLNKGLNEDCDKYVKILTFSMNRVVKNSQHNKDNDEDKYTTTCCVRGVYGVKAIKSISDDIKNRRECVSEIMRSNKNMNGIKKIRGVYKKIVKTHDECMNLNVN